MVILNIIVLLVVLIQHFIQQTYTLSVCVPVDSIFLLNSQVIVDDTNDNKAEHFFTDLVFKASSELAGIGLILYDDIPDGLDSNIIFDLEQTLGENTGSTRHVISNQLRETFNKIENDTEHQTVSINLNDALQSAHKMFVDQSEAWELEALFILDVVDSINGINDTTDVMQKCVNYSSNSGELVEDVYYMEIDSHFNIESIYNCKTEEAVFHYDKLTDLYEITCPSLHNSDVGSMKMGKKDQLIEVGSIKECQLFLTDNEDIQQRVLSPESIVIVYDDKLDDMSYEEGYVMVAVEAVFKTMPRSCYMPVFKITKIKHLSDVGNDHQLLELSVASANMFEYIMESDIDTGDHVEQFILGPEMDQQLIQEQRRRRRRRMLSVHMRRRRLFWGWVEDAVSAVVSVAEAALNEFEEATKVVGGALNDAGDLMVKAADGSINTFRKGFHQIVDGIHAGISHLGDLLDELGNIIGNVLESIVKEVFKGLGIPNGGGKFGASMQIMGELSENIDAFGTKATIDVVAGAFFETNLKLIGPKFKFRGLFSYPQFGIDKAGFIVSGEFNFEFFARLVAKGDVAKTFGPKAWEKYDVKNTIWIFTPIPIILCPLLKVELKVALQNILFGIEIQFGISGSYAIGAEFKPGYFDFVAGQYYPSQFELIKILILL
eukprot:428064_1